MLRHLVLISLFVTVAQTALAANGDTCVADTFTTSCTNNTTLHFCDTTDANGNPQAPVEADLDCTFPNNGTAQLPNGVCGNIDCTDADGGGGACQSLLGDPTCLSGANDLCFGSGALLDGDATNDQFAFGGTCVSGQQCATEVNAQGQISETCETLPQGNACTTPFTAGCAGNDLLLCLGVSEDANNNGALDAGEDKDADNAIDTGVTDSPFILRCSGGIFASCSDSAADGPLHQAGLYGAGAGAAPDCVLAGEGEGEGEGEGDNNRDECETDQDCQGGQTCDNGECVEPPPSCSDTSTKTALPLGAVALLLAVVPAFRRRRG